MQFLAMMVDQVAYQVAVVTTIKERFCHALQFAGSQSAASQPTHSQPTTRQNSQGELGQCFKYTNMRRSRSLVAPGSFNVLLLMESAEVPHMHCTCLAAVALTAAC